MAVILMDEEGKPAARWEFGGAWPIKYDVLDLTAKSNDIAVENLEIAFETIQRVNSVLFLNVFWWLPGYFEHFCYVPRAILGASPAFHRCLI